MSDAAWRSVRRSAISPIYFTGLFRHDLAVAVDIDGHPLAGHHGPRGIAVLTRLDVADRRIAGILEPLLDVLLGHLARRLRTRRGIRLAHGAARRRVLRRRHRRARAPPRPARAPT